MLLCDILIHIHIQTSFPLLLHIQSCINGQPYISLQVSKLSFSLSKDPTHNGHGLVVQLQGKKPSELEKPLHVALGVEGEVFWRTAASAFGDWKVGLAR